MAEKEFEEAFKKIILAIKLEGTIKREDFQNVYLSVLDEHIKVKEEKIKDLNKEIRNLENKKNWYFDTYENLRKDIYKILLKHGLIKEDYYWED